VINKNKKKKQMSLPSMLNHKISINVYLRNISSVVGIA